MESHSQICGDDTQRVLVRQGHALRRWSNGSHGFGRLQSRLMTSRRRVADAFRDVGTVRLLARASRQANHLHFVILLVPRRWAAHARRSACRQIFGEHTEWGHKDLAHPRNSAWKILQSPDGSGHDRAQTDRRGTQRSISLLRAAFEATVDGILAVDPKRQDRGVQPVIRFVEMWRIPESVTRQLPPFARKQTISPRAWWVFPHSFHTPTWKMKTL